MFCNLEFASLIKISQRAFNYNKKKDLIETSEEIKDCRGRLWDKTNVNLTPVNAVILKHVKYVLFSSLFNLANSFVLSSVAFCRQRCGS